MLRLLAGLYLVSSAALALASPYSDWQSDFRQGRLPSAETLLGYWAGRCVSQKHPDKLMPALYVYRTQPTDCDQYCDSQAFYTEPGSDPAKFDKWTIDQVQSDSATSQWLQNADWNPVYTDDGAVDNVDGSGGDSDLTRSVRTAGKGSPEILLRLGYLPFDNDAKTVCRFDTALAQTTPPPPPPPPPPAHPLHWIGDTGPSAGGILTVTNQSPDEAFVSIIFSNQGPDPIRIWDVSVTLASGEVLALPDKLSLDAAGSGAMAFSNGGDKVQSVQFFLYGTAENVQLTGQPHGP
jgi:hypothetical protein